MSYKLGMVSIFVRDLPRAKAFHVDFLGMQVIPEFSGPSFIFLRPVAGTPIALQDIAASPNQSGQPGGIELNLGVDDVDAAWQAWKAKGIEVLTEVTDMGAGRMFRAKDPEGNFLSVSQLYEAVDALRQKYNINM